MLNENEILVGAFAIRYHDIQYHDTYITITQNRIRRRVYIGWYFEDTGTHIYVSDYCAGMFQHKQKKRTFIVNTVTKEWKDFKTVIVERHVPKKVKPVEAKIDESLTR